MLKKVLIIFNIVVLIIGICGNLDVKAANLKTSLDIVKQTSDTEYLENEQGFISKKIVNSKSDVGEITVDLTYTNLKDNVLTEMGESEKSEIYIIVNEDIAVSSSNLNAFVSYVNTLVTKVFARNSSAKIGIIGMTGTIHDVEIDEEGKYIVGDNDEGNVEGSEDNAEIVVNLTKNAEDIKNGLLSMNSQKTEYNNNLQAAIRLANDSYSGDGKKILISLYDGVPQIANGVKSSVTVSSESGSAEEAVIEKHEKIASETRAEILELKQNNIDFILLRPPNTSYDQKWYDHETGEFSFDFDGSPYVQEIYGTLENPTHGKMYSLSSATLQKIVTEYIYEDIINETIIGIKSAVIKEYFSEEILNNFDITFSQNIDKTNLDNLGYVTWNIGDVSGKTDVSLPYTLKIKDMKNEKLLNKVVSISEKTELNYIDYLDNSKTTTLLSSPTVKLTGIEEKEPLTATVSYNPTTNTTGSVTATIRTNKVVNKVDGWTLSEDGMTLTKAYNENKVETVRLVDTEGMTKDVVIRIDNIVKEQEDPTTSGGTLPDTGVSMTVIFSITALIIISIISYKKYSNYREIK